MPVLVLEEECRTCYGSGRNCQRCQGTGMTLTELGEQILDFVRRRLPDHRGQG